MKKFAKYLLTLGIAALSFAACEETPEPVVEPVKYTLSGDTSFKDYKATVKVTADKAAEVDVTVNINLDAASTFTERTLSFPKTISVKKGDTEVSATVEIVDPQALEPGQEYKAIFTASVGELALAEKVTLTYTRPDLRGKWSVIGTVNGSNWDKDFEMTEANGLYVIEGVEAAAGSEFKFRRDGAWDLTYGLDATAVVPLDEEFDVSTKGGNDTNLKLESEGVYSIFLNPNAAKAKVVRTGDLVKIITLADIVALMPAENKATADFKGILNDVVVTYVSGSNVFLEDATSALLLYKKNSGLQAGVKLSGYFEGKIQNYNNLPEISELTYKQEEITIGTAEVPEPAEMTIAEILADFDNLISKRVKLVNVYAGADIQAKGTYDIIQGQDKMTFYTNVDLKTGFKAGSIFDVTAVVTPFNDLKQVKIFEESSITRLIPVMTMSDIQALCTSSSNASFAGVFDGLYVNYILGTQHVYLEDASGALRYYSDKATTLKVGDKISGVITGTCKLDSGRPTINWLDTKYATVTAAPADEQPKPVTGTLASFTDVNGLMYRRVILDNVVLGADLDPTKSSQIITISDATGTFSLHVRFKPSKTYVKGSTLSGTGTFDVASGKLEIRIFAEKEVTITAPAAKELTVERVWGKYPVALGTPWTSEYASTASYIVGNDRTMAMDEEYVYVAAASSSTKGILAISIADPTVVKNVNVDGVEGGLFATACVRTIYNPQTRKHMLLVGSLAYDGDYTFNVYAYMNGIDAAPTKMISWATNNRRVGDFFTVSGDAVKGEIWARTNISGVNPVSFKWDITNGVPGDVMGGQMGYTGAAGMGSIYKYNVDAKQALVVTPNIGRFYNYADSEGWLNANSDGVNWSGIDNSVMARKFGVTPFEFNGKKYIAYVKKGMYNDNGNAARARLKIIEDQGSADTFLASMEADNVLYEFPIQNSNNATT